jgi:hypothetical protein
MTRGKLAIKLPDAEERFVKTPEDFHKSSRGEGQFDS